MKVIGSRSILYANRLKIPFLQCKTSIGNNSGSIKHRAMKFACYLGFLAMATMATEQLQRQNFCSHWTLPVELSSSSAAQSRHHLRTVQMMAEGTPFSGSVNSTTSEMRCLRKTLTMAD